MVNWHRFTPSDFEYDFERDELAAHRITFDEAVECFFSDYLDNVTFQQRATLSHFTRHCEPPLPLHFVQGQGRLQRRSNLIPSFGDCFGRFAPSQ
jgi:hypothetical protein